MVQSLLAFHRGTVAQIRSVGGLFTARALNVDHSVSTPIAQSYSSLEVALKIKSVKVLYRPSC